MTKKPVSERELVLGILIEVTEHGGYSHLVLRDVLSKYQYLEKKERAFITRVTGRNAGTYDGTGLYFGSVLKSKSKKDETGDPQSFAERSIPDGIYGQCAGCGSLQ